MSETGPQNSPDEALVDLLIKQVTEGLSPAEQRELDVLDSAVASDNLREFERAAAAISLAGSANAEPLPEALAQRVARQAEEHFAAIAAAAARTSRSYGSPARTAATGRLWAVSSTVVFVCSSDAGRDSRIASA